MRRWGSPRSAAGSPSAPRSSKPSDAAALAIAGLPPFNGCVSKQLISEGLRGHWVYPLIWLTGAGTVASFAKLSAIFRRVRGAPPPSSPPPPAPRRILPALWILAAACLATGLAPARFAGHFARLLDPRGVTPAFPPVYSPSALIETFPTLAAGLLLYLWLVSPPGARAAAAVRRLATGLNGALVLVLAGFLLLVLALA